ncbi:carbamoyltransferase C-terminal domain-containing protein, partial [Bacteriovoracaceae bacterium]|nr:carbamoyltransferase C-terminal domain-containing protein [Bacteriovoracaceae bacterium]
NLGISKTTFNSSVARYSDDELEIILTERITREKASGKWPIECLKRYKNFKFEKICENRDSSSVSSYEIELEKKSPFLMLLKKKELDRFTKSENKEIIELSHHYAHALSAQYMSPFDECYILVRDGAGSKRSDLKSLCNIEQNYYEDSNSNEMLTLYYLNNRKLECLDKKFQFFKNTKYFSVSIGVGILYEAVAEYIFGSKRASGKVMGLAPFGKYEGEISKEKLLKILDDGNHFRGSGKKEWEASKYIKHYQNIASLIQQLFEQESLTDFRDICKKYNLSKNIILTGGTALNCTFNMKLVKLGLFDNIYIPPFPGDECISMGCSLFENKKNIIVPIGEQHGYFGPVSNIPDDKLIQELFKSWNIKKCNNVEEEAATLIKKGKIIAWYQGRSESGPRALGNRSILAPLGVKGVKSYLNSKVKFRESFRPYGSSFLKEEFTKYFDVSDEFHSPFMSFSIPVKNEFQELLSEVMHVDGTSRAQSVTRGQNLRFYKLLEKVKEQTGIGGVLNTSMNIMGEPIVESVNDFLDFATQSNLEHFVIGDYIIEK